MPYADVNHTRLHYRFDGPEDAPVIVLSNSLGTDLDMWQPQLPALAERFRVLRYDSRGHGGSQTTPDRYTIELLATDLMALLDHLDLRRVHCCGLSMGGMVGQWLGVHAPERIARLALCNTAAYIGPAELWDRRIEAVRGGGMAAIADGVLARWFTAGFRQQGVPAALSQVTATLLETSAEGYIACCAAIRDMDQRPAVSAIRLPTLIIAGSHDQATPPDDGHFLATQIQGARYLELNAAHLSNIEDAERFTSAMLEFFTD
ncbi:MAG: 3-oxoadipate enol-lactonase [Azospirillum sp.]|nr:3-oxoadipate enol-lactonase [Azospirillum sp.]